jgi:hypothetical protein
MLRRIATYVSRHHVGFIALAVALTGSAYAASKVGPHDIQKNAVRSRHVDNGQLRGRDLHKLRTFTDTVQIADPDPPSEAGHGTATVFCPGKDAIVAGIETTWKNFADDELYIGDIRARDGLAQVTGLNDTSSSAILVLRASCLPR